MQSRLLIIFFILAAALLPESICHAAPITPLEGLEALRKGFLGTSDFSAEITQEKRFSIMKRVMLTNGNVRFRKPDLFFMETKPPYASRLLLRDNLIEQSNGRDGNKNRIVLPPEQSLKQWFTKLATPVATIPEGVQIRAELTGSTYTLHILPKKRGQIKELTISFLADGTIRRIVINEHNGDRATMTFKRFRRNISLTEKDFLL